MPSYITDADLSSNQLAFCGGVAGVVSRFYSESILKEEGNSLFYRFVIAPLDVVKIRMQLQTHSVHVKNNKQPIKYSSILQTLKTIMKEEGIRGLYKGNMPAEYLYLSYTMIEFWSYKELEQLIESNQKQIPETLKSFGCGMIAGSIATASTYPFDLLRTQFAIAQKNHRVPQEIMNIYKKEGYRGFYKGLWPAIIQIMPYMGLLFSSYDIFAKGFKKLRDSERVSSAYKPTHDMMSGALSGMTSKIAVYPFDLVRKRLQVQGTPIPWYTCFYNVAKQEGARSLYKGLAPSLIKVAPANAVTFMVFEEAKDFLLWFKKW